MLPSTINYNTCPITKKIFTYYDDPMVIMIAITILTSHFLLITAPSFADFMAWSQTGRQEIAAAN